MCASQELPVRAGLFLYIWEERLQRGAAGGEQQPRWRASNAQEVLGPAIGRSCR
jgi:hypothetical protein